MEEGIISKSKPKVRKVDLDEEDSDFECYDRSDWKTVYVDIIDKEKTKRKQTGTSTATEQIARRRN